MRIEMFHDVMVVVICNGLTRREICPEVTVLGDISRMRDYMDGCWKVSVTDDDRSNRTTWVRYSPEEAMMLCGKIGVSILIDRTRGDVWLDPLSFIGSEGLNILETEQLLSEICSK